MKVTDDRESIRGRFSIGNAMSGIAMFLLAVAIGSGLSGCVTQTIPSRVSQWQIEPKKLRKPIQRSAKPVPLSEPSATVATEQAALPTEAIPAAIPAAVASETPATPSTPSAPSIPSASARPSADLAVLKTEAQLRKDLRPKAPAPLLGVASLRAKANGEAHLIFDLPVTYNSRVKKWIKYFQTAGRPSFRRWLERSSRFIPFIQAELKKAGLPLDLVYVAMIESGFSSNAASHANAIGLWQFIVPTGERYGLKYDWWIDERRDFEKSTQAAIGYMSELFEQFGSWYLVTASYNMGENGVRRLIKRYRTNSYWDLVERGALPDETGNYVPKMLAAILISKAPALYGFRDLEMMLPFAFETVEVPGGTDLPNLARYLAVSERTLSELNPELVRGFIPRDITKHRIRIPKGARLAVSQYVAMTSSGTQLK